MKKNKKGMELEMLGWWIIGLIAFVIVVLAIMMLKGKGFSAINFLKELFKYGK